ASSALVASFSAFDPSFTGGVTVAAGDVNGDLKSDIVAGAGAGAQPVVLVVDATKMTQLQANRQIAASALLAGFYAFDPSFRGGVYVAAGNFNSDPFFADIIVGAGFGAQPVVLVVDGTKATQTQANGQISSSALLAGFLAYDASVNSGVRVGAVDVNGDGLEDIITGPGPGTGPR